MRVLQILLVFVTVSCASTKFSPQNKYRFSRTYTKELNSRIPPVDEEICMNQVLFAIGHLRYNKIKNNLGLDTDSIYAMIEKSLISHLHPYNLNVDSLETKSLTHFAFTDYYSRKLKWNDLNLDQGCGKYSLLPYLEMSVRSHYEIEGDGLWGSAARTGNRLYWVYYGMILSLRENEKEIFSNGVYYTELIAVKEDSVPVFDFPASRIDSLVSLCLTDFPFKKE